MRSDANLARQRRALFPRMGDLAQAQPAVPQALIRDFLYRPRRPEELDTRQGGGVVFSQVNPMKGAPEMPVGGVQDPHAPKTRTRHRQVEPRLTRPMVLSHPPISWPDPLSVSALVVTGRAAVTGGLGRDALTGLS